jgi:hypothetical protein
MFFSPAMMSRPTCLERTELPETTPWHTVMVLPGTVSILVMNMEGTF